MPESPNPPPPQDRTKIVFFANTDWYLYHFRISLARRAASHFNAEIWVACPDGAYRALLEAEGYRWIPIALRRRSLNPLHDLLVAWQFSRVLRGIEPDLIHAFTLKSIVIANFAARLAGVPRIVNAVTGLGSLYGGQSFSYAVARGVLGLFFRFFLPRRQVRTIFQNPEDLGRIAAQIDHHGSFRLIYGSGVNTVLFHPPEGGDAHLVVLMASRLIRDKGIEVLCRAAHLVLAEMEDVEFWIAGEVDLGNPTSYTREEIADLALEHPMIRFLGHREDMAELFRHATLAVLPALAREGLPRTLIEACASGLALVASDVEGVREVVLQGRNGMLVPPGDAGALASALLTILKDPQRRAAMGKESRALAMQRFDEEKVFEETLAVYSELGLVPFRERLQ